MHSTDGAQRDRYPWLWDVEMDADTFRQILNGERNVRGRDWRWALVRLIEYAPYAEIRRLLSAERLLATWPQVAGQIRSSTRREGMEYLYQRLRAQAQGA